MLEQQVSSLMTAIRDDLLTGEKKVYEGIVLSPMINQIQEVIFRNYYLPCFAGFVNPPNWIMNWTQVAGNPMSEVSVVDEQGNELFRVPPLLASSKAVLENRDGSLRDIFNRQELLKNSLSGNHTEYVFQALDGKTRELDQRIEMDAPQRWNLIFQRYGIAPASASQQQEKQPGEDDIFQY